MSAAVVFATIATGLAAAGVTVPLLLRRRMVWQRFARRHGLEFQTAGNRPAVRGVLDGRPVALLTTAERADGGAGPADVELTVGLLRPLPDGLAVESRSAADPSAAAEHVGTGDGPFDARILVRGRDPDEVAGWLNPRRRRALLDLLEAPAPAVVAVTGGAIRIREPGAATSLARLDTGLAAVLAAARALEEG